MTDTIDIGVDLGTTNSAIAVAEGDAATVVKNNEGSDVTPSAVWMPKPGVVWVGRKARERVELDPDNAAAEFKQEMGLADAVRGFARAGVALTPPQLSAEVLGSLRADAAHRNNGEAPDAAVITVPAAFELNQNKATTDAAALAGFTASCRLVQEPTAAAFAYGFNDADDRAYWMVFDFGGGTFDAAVVSKRDGDLRVLDHAGDQYLGGKLIDWAIVDRVLAPAAARDLRLREFTRDNTGWRINFARLKGAAEEAKIRLSREETAELTVDLVTADGSTDTFDYDLRRDELDSVAEPFYARAITMCRAALRDASLHPTDIDRLLLVGGVTLAPGLRERLADERDGLGIALETRLDPSTVVARGAAIFAGTVRRPSRAPESLSHGEFGIELQYEPSVTSTNPAVAGRCTGRQPVDWTGYGITLSNPDGSPPFSSPRLRLNEAGAFVTDVQLTPHSTSRFTVELTDSSGKVCPLTPNTLTITHRAVEFGGVRLTHSLGVQLADGGCARLLRKNATLPATADETFSTSRALHRADTDALLCIPIVQGERDRGQRNREVGTLEVRPRDVRVDLPEGTEVRVSFEMDASSVLSAFADIPLAQVQVEAEIDLDTVRAPDASDLRAQLAEAEDRLDLLRGSVAGSSSADAAQMLATLDEERTVDTAREQVQAAGVDAGAAATAEVRIRDLQARLDDIADAVRLPELVDELRELLAAADDLAARNGNAADRKELAALHERAGDAVQSGDATAVRAQRERAGELVGLMESRDPDFPVRLYHSLREATGSTSGAAPLLQQGDAAVRDRDEPALNRANRQLIGLLPKEEQDAVIGLVRRS